MSKSTKKQRRDKRKSKKSKNLSYEEIAEIAKDLEQHKVLAKYTRLLAHMKTVTLGMY